MSAICGAVGLDGRGWAPRDLAGVLDALAPLGPTRRGTWAGRAGRCGVVIGAAQGTSTPQDLHDVQPVAAPGGSLMLVADVRLDNRDELAGALGVPDDEVTPDSAFVLAAYARWGEGCLERLTGEFALALVDFGRGAVMLARDHVGARPLALHIRRGTVAFASMPLALTAFEGVGHDLDETHAAEILALAYSSERTFVRGVEWLAPGSAAWIELSGVTRREWWAPDPSARLDVPPYEHERRLRDALDAAVAARLRSAGAVAAGVSGGLDSTSIAATAARLLDPAPLRIYTSAPRAGWGPGPARPGWDADETPLVTALADAHPNMIPSVVHVESDARFLELQEPMWALGAGPARNPCNLVWMHRLRVRARADGAATLLHGDFGNFFFSADGPAWLAALLRSGRIARFAREASAWRRSNGESWTAILRRHLLGELLPYSVRRLVRRGLGRPPARDEWLEATGLRRDIAERLPLETLVPHLDERRRGDGRASTLAVRAHYAGLADVASALAAVTGVEARDPMSDRRVVEVAMRQPEWVRRHDGQTRAVARGAMSDRLPDAIRTRTRRGEQFPDWLDAMTAERDDIEAEVDAMDANSVAAELIDVERLRSLVRSWPDARAWADPAVVRDYRVVLLRSAVVSRYLRWFEDHAKAARRSDVPLTEYL